MDIGILGTGAVGRTLGTRLADLGHAVRLGARSASNETAAAWVAEAPDARSHGTFADAAAFGAILLNCTNGLHSVAAVEAAGAEPLAGKTLIDVANPFAIEGGRARLTVANTDSLAEQLQRALPETRVVKSLNTINCAVMADPGLVAGEHVVFVCSDHDAAKDEATALLEGFGWAAARIIDLGGLIHARSTEMYLPLWVDLMGPMGGSRFNISLNGPAS